MNTELLDEIQQRLQNISVPRARWRDEISRVLDSYGFEYVGNGIGRIVACPRPSTPIQPPVSEYEHDHAESVVVKFARQSREIVSEMDGIEQNRREGELWGDLVDGNSPELFDSVSGSWRQVPIEWIPPVRASASDWSWIVSTGYARLEDAYPKDREAQLDVSAAVDGEFLEGEIRPDASPSNVGLREVSLQDALYGEDVEWPSAEAVVGSESWVVVDSGIPNHHE